MHFFLMYDMIKENSAQRMVAAYTRAGDRHAQVCAQRKRIVQFILVLHLEELEGSFKLRPLNGSVLVQQ